MSIAICAVVWGDFWEKYGVQFIEQMSKLKPQPNEIIISSPEPLDVPVLWHNIVQPHKKWDCWNDTMFFAHSDWVLPVGIDDIWYEDALAGLSNIPDMFQIMNVACMENGRLWAAEPEAFNEILNISSNPMLGATMIRRSILWSIPFRQVVWNDWIQWMEIRKLGYKVGYIKKPLCDHIRRPESYSISAKPEGEAECELMRTILREHEVVPGVEFPPRILK